MSEFLARVQVDSREKWNASGVVVEEGREYEIRAEPAGQTWRDFYLPAAGPEGRDSLLTKLFRRWLRVRQIDGEKIKFMALIAVIGRDLSSAIKVGSQIRFTSRGSGEMYFFANDVGTKRAYRNNRGQISVAIYSIPEG